MATQIWNNVAGNKNGKSERSGKYDDNNNLESCNSFSEGDIVMLINLINYMKENNQNTVYLKDCAGNYEDFRLLD